MAAVSIGKQGAIQMRYFDNATDADLMAAAPAIFAATAGSGHTKATYQQVRTIDLINGMREQGWAVTMAGQKFTRDSARTDYARHMLRLRHETATGTDFVPEAIVLNAHDGSAAFRFYTGAFRFVCGNGLVFGELVSSLRLLHRNTTNGVGMAGAVAQLRSAELLKAAPGNMALVEQYKATHWTKNQAQEFAARAVAIRWLAPHPAPIVADSLLSAPMLTEDKDGSAWGWFNHVQHHLCRDGSAAGGERMGGIAGVTATGRATSVRPVTRIDEVTRVNIGLWSAMRAVCEIGKAGSAKGKAPKKMSQEERNATAKRNSEAIQG